MFVANSTFNNKSKIDREDGRGERNYRKVNKERMHSRFEKSLKKEADWGDGQEGWDEKR